MASRETENNAYAKFWGDKQRALWYVMVFLEWSIRYVCLLTISILSSAYLKFALFLFCPFPLNMMILDFLVFTLSFHS